MQSCAKLPHNKQVHLKSLTKHAAAHVASAFGAALAVLAQQRAICIACHLTWWLPTPGQSPDLTSAGLPRINNRNPSCISTLFHSA